MFDLKNIKLIEPIGKGSFGVAYLVEYKDIKMVLKRINNKSQTENTIKEAELSIKMHCRYIIHSYDYIIDENNDVCILMEYCKYKNLFDIITYLDENNVVINTDGILKYFIDIVMGLRYLHKNKIIHRDIKPENIFITNDNVCVLGDFGLSTVLSSERSKAKSTVGSPLYMAPEVNDHSITYDTSADIWSLGCVLFELCTYIPAYYATNGSKSVSIEELQKIPFKEQNKKIRKSLDSRLYDIICGCLEYDVNKRLTIEDIYNNDLIQEYIAKGYKNTLYKNDTFISKSFSMRRKLFSFNSDDDNEIKVF